MNGKDKIYLNIKVQSRARKPGLEKVSPGEYKVRVSAPPSKGEANKEIVKTLASHFGLPPSRVKIIRGQKSQRKLVQLEVNNSM